MSILAKLRAAFTSKTQVVKICFIGLDKAGKSSVLKWLIGEKFDESINKRTIGMEVAKIKISGLEFIAWDIGGQKGFRETIWQSYMLGSKAIIYVIDSSDRGRIQESSLELEKYVFSNSKLNSTPILLLANKQDSNSSLSVKELEFLLNLNNKRNINYKLIGVSCKTGYNLQEAFNWLCNQIYIYDRNIPLVHKPLMQSFNI